MQQLITILNRCHRFPGFVYHQARFSSDHQSIEIAVRPRKGSLAVWSRCHQPGPGYDQLAERRLEFIPFWGFLVFLVYCGDPTSPICPLLLLPSATEGQANTILHCTVLTGDLETESV